MIYIGHMVELSNRDYTPEIPLVVWRKRRCRGKHRSPRSGSMCTYNRDASLGISRSMDRPSKNTAPNTRHCIISSKTRVSGMVPRLRIYRQGSEILLLQSAQ